MGCLIEIAFTSLHTVPCKPRTFTLKMRSCARGRLQLELHPKEAHSSCINTTQDFKAVAFLFMSPEAGKKHVGSSLTIAMCCKLIIKAGWRKQLPAVKNIYNCKYYISTVEQVNRALWKCLLYRSAHQKGERISFCSLQQRSSLQTWRMDF